MKHIASHLHRYSQSVAVFVFHAREICNDICGEEVRGRCNVFGLSWKTTQRENGGGVMMIESYRLQFSALWMR